MPFIRTLILHDRSIYISPPWMPFRGFFGIDSFHVILGKNGAGKTSMLGEIAALFRSRTVDPSVLVQEAGDSVRPLSNEERKRMGVVFYTSLPYRRKISTGVNVIDASTRGGDDQASIDAFKRVSDALGQETSLVGNVAYTPDVFAEVLNPALLSVRGSEQLHPQLLAIREGDLLENV